MIRITNIRNARPTDGYNEIWAIVRSLKSKSQYLTQVAALSPSMDLFMRYRRLAANNQWNRDTFEQIYLPQFLREMRSREAIEMLAKLWDADKAGKNICLVCFCPDETMCHRSIIAGLLQGSGCHVVTDTGNDYSRYYDMYRNI